MSNLFKKIVEKFSSKSESIWYTTEIPTYNNLLILLEHTKDNRHFYDIVRYSPVESKWIFKINGNTRHIKSEDLNIVRWCYIMDIK